MRLPFMQLESDFLAHGASELGILARCSPAQAIGHVSLLRAWAVSHASDEAPPDGWVAGDAAARRIEAAAQWTGEPGVLLQALLDAGQVRREEGGIRVLHLEPYVQAWNKNNKAKERMRTLRERSLHAPQTPDEGSAKFRQQTQTQTQKEASASQGENPLSPDAGGPPSDTATEMAEAGDALPDATEHAEELGPEERPVLELQLQQAGRKQRALSKAEVLYQEFQRLRRERCEEAGVAFVDDGWKPARQNRDLGQDARLPRDSEGFQRLTAAWEAYLADESKAALDVPWSLGFFLASRATWEGRALKAAGGAS